MASTAIRGTRRVGERVCDEEGHSRESFLHRLSFFVIMTDLHKADAFQEGRSLLNISAVDIPIEPTCCARYAVERHRSVLCLQNPVSLCGKTEIDVALIARGQHALDR